MLVKESLNVLMSLCSLAMESKEAFMVLYEAGINHFSVGVIPFAIISARQITSSIAIKEEGTSIPKRVHIFSTTDSVFDIFSSNACNFEDSSFSFDIAVVSRKSIASLEKCFAKGKYSALNLCKMLLQSCSIISR